MSDEKLLISENQTEDSVKFILKGRINAESATILQRKLDEASQKNRQIILNMRQVPFLSSGGIRVLLMFYKILNAKGGSFFVEDPSDNVKNVLGMTALEELLFKK